MQSELDYENKKLHYPPSEWAMFLSLQSSTKMPVLLRQESLCFGNTLSHLRDEIFSAVFFQDSSIIVVKNPAHHWHSKFSCSVRLTGAKMDFKMSRNWRFILQSLPGFSYWQGNIGCRLIVVQYRLVRLRLLRHRAEANAYTTFLSGQIQRFSYSRICFTENNIAKVMPYCLQQIIRDIFSVW